jgi:hypothetical protein
MIDLLIRERSTLCQVSANKLGTYTIKNGYKNSRIGLIRYGAVCGKQKKAGTGDQKVFWLEMGMRQQ